MAEAAVRAKIDPIDVQLLRALCLNARSPNNELAEQIGMSASATLNRVKRLEVEHVILGYRTDVDLTPIQSRVVLWIELRLTAAGRLARSEVERALEQDHRITRVHRLVGQSDYLLMASCSDVSEWAKVAVRLDAKGVWVDCFSVQIEEGTIKNAALLPQLLA